MRKALLVAVAMIFLVPNGARAQSELYLGVTDSNHGYTNVFGFRPPQDIFMHYLVLGGSASCDDWDWSGDPEDEEHRCMYWSEVTVDVSLYSLDALTSTRSLIVRDGGGFGEITEYIYMPVFSILRADSWYELEIEHVCCYNSMAIIGVVGLYDEIPATVPEPMSLILLGTGLAGVAVVGRRRRREQRKELSHALSRPDREP